MIRVAILVSLGAFSGCVAQPEPVPLPDPRGFTEGAVALRIGDWRIGEREVAERARDVGPGIRHRADSGGPTAREHALGQCARPILIYYAAISRGIPLPESEAQAAFDRRLESWEPGEGAAPPTVVDAARAANLALLDTARYRLWEHLDREGTAAPSSLEFDRRVRDVLLDALRLVPVTPSSARAAIGAELRADFAFRERRARRIEELSRQHGVAR